MSVDVEEQTARAKLLIAQRQYQEAVRACRRVLLTYPDRVDVRLLLGQALLALGRFDEVRAEMLSLSRESPRLAAAQRVLGEAYLRDGQVERARAFLERARALDPTDTAAIELMAELEGEEPGLSSTVERWFDPEAVATVQTNPPGYAEENTGQVAIGGGVKALSSSVQVDPSLGARVISPPIQPPMRRPASIPALGPQRRPEPLEEWDDETSEDEALSPRTMARPAPERARAPEPKRHDATRQLDIDDIEPVSGDVSNPSLDPFDPDDEIEGEATVARLPPAEDDGVLTPARSRPPIATPYSSREAPAQSQPPARARSLPPSSAPAPRSGPPPAFPHDPIPMPPTAAGRATSGPPPPPPPRANTPYPAPPSPGPSQAPQSRGATQTAHRKSTLLGIPPAPPPTGLPTGISPAVPPPPPPSGPSLSGPPPPAPYLSAQPNATPSGPTPQPPGPPPPPLPPGVSPMPETRLQVAVPPVEGRPDTSRIKTGKKGPPTVLLVAGGVALLLIVGIGAFFGVRGYLRGRELAQIRAAVDAATDEGTKGTLEAASELASKRTSEPEVAALRARLLAIASLEHAADHSADVRALLAAVGTDPLRPDAQIASAYVRLANGEADVARREAASIIAEGSGAADAARVRALASASLGQLPQALLEARTAAQLRPGSPRHTALLALLTAQTGNIPTARTLLDTIPSGERSPAVRVTRARVLIDMPGGSAGAAAEAEAVLGALANVSSPPERAWAQLVRARVAVDGGDSTSALQQARQAATAKPQNDEAFGLLLAEVLLKSGAPTDARTALAGLPPMSNAATRRALLVAEVALALGDLAGAEAALPQAGDGPRVDMLRGRVLEARGQPDRAIEAYRRAASDPVLAVRAKVRLGALHLAAGRAREAAQLLDEARAIAPADAELVPLEVRALVRINQLESADIVVRDALARRADAPEFLAARAFVQLARGDVQGALSALRTAAGVRPNDADIQASLGDAARRASEREEARRAFDAALAIAPTQPIALAGLAILAADSGDVTAARAAIERATQAGANGPELAQARLRVAVLEGAGDSQVAEARTLAQQMNDASTWSALGRLQLQAERDRDASDSFRRALEIDARDAEALLGRGLIGIRNGDLGGAAERLTAASAAATERRLGADIEARILSARGRLRFEFGNFGDAAARAREAIAKDSRCGDAHLLLANIAIETSGDPIGELRAATTGTAPPPEAVGRLAARLPAGQEACDLAARYLRAAPQGYDAETVRAVRARCSP